MAAQILGPSARRFVPLGAMTTYRVGGPASVFVEVGSLNDLNVIAQAVVASGVEVLVLGRGSNLLVADSGFDGLAVSLGPFFSTIEVVGTEVMAGGAASLPVLARRTAAAGLRGLEWAVGIPGSVGGGVRMNAGGHGAVMSDCLRRVELFDLAQRGAEARRAVEVDDLKLGYRRSSVSSSQVVTVARFGLQLGDRSEAEKEIAAIVRWRRAHQPGGANAGSVFVNPPDDAAGRLLEAAGLRGFRWGSAFVSTRHANFVQADPQGSADDVLALIRYAQRSVHERFGVKLDFEVRCVGFSSDLPDIPNCKLEV